MPATVKLIADSGSTKADWCLVTGKETRSYTTQGMSPYFLSGDQIQEIVRKELVPQLPANVKIDEIIYYGTGCSQVKSAQLMQDSLGAVWPDGKVSVSHDLMAAARALCGHEKGIASILGTGSNSCYYDGEVIVKNNPGLGYVLGDEGSGAYLGKKVIQYYLYNTFDEEIRERFELKYNNINKDEILENVYRRPLANRYLASFTLFLAENRGHYMIENILEDGLNDFFFNHIYKYRESWTTSLHFVGSVAWYFQDIIKELCELYELPLGKIIHRPMDGLVAFHQG